jgi:hypothetical protein
MNQIALVIVALALAGCSGADEGPTRSPAADTSGVSAQGGPGSDTHSGGMDARNAGHNATRGAFGAACASGAECESSVCFSGGKGGFCSVSCTTDAVCPSGAAGAAPHCNPHGYCRY